MQSNCNAQGGAPRANRRPLWLWLIVCGCLGVVLLGILLPRPPDKAKESARTAPPTAEATGAASANPERYRPPRRPANAEAGLTAEQTVADKVSRFAGKRRDTARAMAKRLGLEMPAEVERFFDLAAAGRWDELHALFLSLKEERQQPGSPEALKSLWGPILETFGVAEVAHDWPAQKLLDYGQAVLGSLRPGMVYVGGTDCGRFIPTLLNETGDGEPHIVLTQNALADNTYLDYLRSLYGDRMATLSPEDSQRAFQEYIADAQKRLAHDQQFPDEPAQIRPGEDVRSTDGSVQVSGQVAVMMINERLFQTLLDKNPDLSFALEESFPFKSTYATAAPLGPVMELRAADPQKPLTAEAVDQAIDYWRSATDPLLAEGGPADTPIRQAYSKMAVAQASLFADHQFPAEAEQAYRLATDLCPTSPEAVFRYINLLVTQQRFADAQQIAQAAVRGAPDNQQFTALLEQLKKRGN
jgi:hypothetical protein